jgi:VCBS repeat-containing protein
MANNVPIGKGPTFFSGPEAAYLIEAQNPTVDLTASGDLFFKDVSKPDSLHISTTVTASRSSGGAVPLSNAELLAALTTSLDEYNNGGVRGDIAWDFSLLSGDVNFLAAGEKLTLTYHITFTDPSGGSATQAVTVTILGVNHPPAFTSGPEAGSVAELANTTGSPTLDTTPTGTLAFTDQDISNTHTVSVSVASATWSGGSAIPAATLTDLANALATTLNDSTGTGSGSVNWTFSIPDKDLDFLAQGETLTTVYDVKVSDGSSSATQTVTITAVGANDAATITSGPESATVAEQPNVTGSSTPDTSAPGTLSFTDADLTDTHAVTVTLDSAVWSNNSFGVPPQALADLQSALATTLTDSTGTGSGSVNWSFSIPDKDLDFLGAGETLTATYDVTVSDGAGSSSTQNVVITMTGAEDPLVVNPVVNQVSDTQFTDTNSVLGGGDLFTDGSASTADLSTALSVSAVNGQAANVDHFVAGTYGDLFVDSGGFYEYVANSSVDPLQPGQNVTDQFTYTVTDSLGRTETATLTFDITGADDAPVITAADTVGSMTEDAGPNTIVNGGFETGDLTGWSASSSAVSAEFLGIGGAFGNYGADLGPTASAQSLSQNVATTPGQQYTLSFFVAGDPDSASNALTVSWDGVPILSLNNVPLGFNQYTFTVMGDASAATTPLVFSYTDDADGLLLDQVSVNSTTPPATQTAQGSIHFTDAETGDTHVASFQPDGSGYLGTFSLDPVSEGPGSGSVEWHFSVDNSAIQFLSQGQTLTQDYTVTITDENGASTTQDVTILINGANDPPVANADNVITDVGANGTSSIPGWALTQNDTDPDTNEWLNVNSVDSSSGGTAVANPPTGVSFTDDGTLGGQFSYDTTDGMAVSNPATVTFNNNASSSSSLAGTGGNDIIIGNNAGESLSGGAGNDILIANAANQTLTGGTGNDIFAFEQPLSGPASITDFNNTSQQDQIALSAAGFGGGLTAGMDLSSVFETSADSQFASSDSRLHFDTGNQTLYFSADGTSASEVAVAELQAGTMLQSNNMLIVR